MLAAIIVANISSVADGMDMIANGDAFGQLLAGFGGLILLVIVIVAWNILRWWKTTLTIKGDILIYERRTLKPVIQQYIHVKDIKYQSGTKSV